MEDGCDSSLFGNVHSLETGFSELADADGEHGLEDIDDGLEVLVAGGEESLSFGDGEFVGGAIAAALFHENQGTVVGDKVIDEEVVRIRILFFEEPPEAATGDFGFLAGESFDDTFGMLIGWLGDGGFDFHPIADVSDFAKGDSCLSHSPRTWIHA